MKNLDENYAAAFAIILRAVPSLSCQTAREAEAHRYMIYDMGYGDGHPFPVISFRAVCAHIRTEKNLPTAAGYYTAAFRDKAFCTRLVAGLML